MLTVRCDGKNLKIRNGSSPEPSKKDVERALRDAVGMTRKQAKTFLSVGFDACAAMFGWEIDSPRDVGSHHHRQPGNLRDAGDPGPFDLGAFLARIKTVT